MILAITESAFLVVSVALNVWGESRVYPWLKWRFAFLRSRVRRITWPYGRVALERSYDQVFGPRLKRKRSDYYGKPDEPELWSSHRDLERWLQEDSQTTVAEEIYLVRVGRSNVRQRALGVLYATLYPAKRKDRGSVVYSKWCRSKDRCLIWNLMSAPDLPKEEEVAVLGDLWDELRSVIRQRWDSKNVGGPGECEYYFEVVEAGHWPPCEGDEEERRTRLVEFVQSDAVQARKVDFDYRRPDWESWCEEESRASTNENRDEKPASLYYTTHEMSPPDRLPTAEVLKFVYETAHTWSFTYAEDVLEVDELGCIVEYFTGLSEWLKKKTGPQALLA